jgi:hypothetical protein
MTQTKNEQRKLKEGYNIFTAISTVSRGFDECAMMLQDQIQEAEKTFEVTPISGASFKDDSGERNVYFGQQTAILKLKQQPPVGRFGT